MVGSKVVDQTCEKLWPVVSDFKEGKWLASAAPPPTYSADGNEVGAKRTITSLGPAVVEELTAKDATAMTYTYAMVAPDFGPFPVSAYEVTVSLTASGTGCSMTMDGTAVYEGPDGVNAEVPFMAKDSFIGMMSTFYGAWIMDGYKLSKTVYMKATKEVEHSAEEMWPVVSDFKEGKWLAAAAPPEHYSSTGNEVGAKRTITSLGPAVVEELTAKDATAMTYTYSMVAPNFGPFPVSAYEVTVSLTALAKGCSMTMDGMAVYEGPDGVNATVPFMAKDSFVAMMSGFYGDWISAAAALVDAKKVHDHGTLNIYSYTGTSTTAPAASSTVSQLVSNIFLLVLLAYAV